MQLRKESLKKKKWACTGFEPLTFVILVQRSGSRSLNWFVINPARERMMMTL